MAKTILMPTLREKKRYLVFEVISKQKKQAREVDESIWSSCLDYLGEKGCAEAGIHVLKEKWDGAKQMGMVKVNNKYVNDLKTAMALNNKLMIKSLTTTGMIKKAQERIAG